MAAVLAIAPHQQGKVPPGREGGIADLLFWIGAQ